MIIVYTRGENGKEYLRVNAMRPSFRTSLIEILSELGFEGAQATVIFKILGKDYAKNGITILVNNEGAWTGNGPIDCLCVQLIPEVEG